jgi:hypothetical protein
MQSVCRLTPAILAIAMAPYITAQSTTPVAPATPPRPVNVSAKVSASGVEVYWTPGVGTSSGTTYNIYSGTGSAPPDIKSTDMHVHVGVNVTNSPDLITPAPGTYNYVVVAVNGGVVSEASESTGEVVVTGAQPETNNSSNVPASNTTSAPCPPSSDPKNVIVGCKVISNYTQLQKIVNGPIDVSTGTIDYTRRADLTTLTPSCDETTIDAVLYNVINLNSDQSVATPRWYLYEPRPGYKKGIPTKWTVVDFDDSTRLYGIKKLEVVSVVLNATSTNPTVTYVIQSTKAQPTNVSDFLGLLSVVGANGPTPAPERASPIYVIGCTTVDTGFSTSSIQVGANIDGSNSKQLAVSQTITNEAKAWWDVSFALPIKKASALQYSSTSNTVTATQINKQNLFATFDFYPFCSDLKASYSWSPAFFGGVALASQPLHSILTGVSMHFSMVSVYAGALFIKQQQLNGLAVGASGTSAQVSAATKYGFKPSFSVGIKLSIKAGAAQLTSKK